MADEVTVKMTGVEDVLSSIKQIAIASPTAVMKGVKRVAAKIERQAKLSVPVDTGRLRASISFNWTGSGMEHGEVHQPSAIKPLNKKGKPSKPLKPDDLIGAVPVKPDTFTAVIGTNVEYAPAVEFGEAATHEIGAPHFMYASYFAYEGDVEKEISAELGKELAKAMKK
jgi:phage gpG-like protein